MSQSQVKMLANQFNVALQNQQNECCRKEIIKLMDNVALSMSGWSRNLRRVEFLKLAGHPDHV